MSGLQYGSPHRHWRRQRLLSSEREFGFASVVRCSLTGRDRTKGTHTADSPDVIPAFRPDSVGHAFVSACVDEHLGLLPPSTHTAVLLGNSNPYTRRLRHLFGIACNSVTRINDVAYRASEVAFVHGTHPSKGNGYFGAFNRGRGCPPNRSLTDQLGPDDVDRWFGVAHEQRLDLGAAAAPSGGDTDLEAVGTSGWTAW